MLKNKFKIIKTDKNLINNYMNISTKYSQTDMSFYTIASNSATVLCLDGNSFGLAIDANTKNVTGLIDYVGDLKKFKNKIIAVPNYYEDAILQFDSGISLQNGFGYILPVQMEIFFDYNSNAIQFGYFNVNATTYRIAKNMFVQLDELNQLKNIIVSDLLDEK